MVNLKIALKVDSIFFNSCTMFFLIRMSQGFRHFGAFWENKIVFIFYIFRSVSHAVLLKLSGWSVVDSHAGANFGLLASKLSLYFVKNKKKTSRRRKTTSVGFSGLVQPGLPSHGDYRTCFYIGIPNFCRFATLVASKPCFQKLTNLSSTDLLHSLLAILQQAAWIKRHIFPFAHAQSYRGYRPARYKFYTFHSGDLWRQSCKFERRQLL